MSEYLNIQKVLKETEELLQNIESELIFRLPDSKKLADIRNMVIWLKGGEPIPAYNWSTQVIEATVEDDNIDPFGCIDPFYEPFGFLDKIDDDGKT